MAPCAAVKDEQYAHMCKWTKVFFFKNKNTTRAPSLYTHAHTCTLMQKAVGSADPQAAALALSLFYHNIQSECNQQQ